MERYIESLWYRISPWHILLWPLSLAYGAVTAIRRALYRANIFKTQSVPVPVIVVGNITAGGSGKTPLVIWLAEFLQQQGYRPGVISRGYGREGDDVREVASQSRAAEVGDEPLLISRRANCPVVVGRDRVAAAQMLLEKNPQVNVIISDDGLQHDKLARQMEICVVDGARGFGNGCLIPAGPLRETTARLNQVDALIVNGEDNNSSIKSNTYVSTMKLAGSRFTNLHATEVQAQPDYFKGKNIHAVAGIGNPSRFFAHLNSLGLQITHHAFPDHHVFSAEDITFANADAVLMTEKDAVKCSSFATEHCWSLAVSAELDATFGARVLEKLKEHTS
ncbi:MAG: tetraacyldisaccharide 4-kinase [Pseudomonadota bacterium]|jgi:tetraacyldisaccharide 4'-kinase